jgi:hypothetical protein
MVLKDGHYIKKLIISYKYMNQIYESKEQKWYKIPNIILLSYKKSERAKVNDIFPNINRWRNDIKYVNIKIIFFEYCDRGIDCWKGFNNFLKNVFPNLEVLFLHQSWTYDNTHNFDYSDPNIYKITDQIEQQEFFEFMDDTWLKVIWIKQESNQFPNHNDIQSEHIRVMYKNNSMCPGNCYNESLYGYTDCYCNILLFDFENIEFGTILGSNDILKDLTNTE